MMKDKIVYEHDGDLKFPGELKDIPFPECATNCRMVKLLGVGECDSVCPDKEEKK